MRAVGVSRTFLVVVLWETCAVMVLPLTDGLCLSRRDHGCTRIARQWDQWSTPAIALGCHTLHEPCVRPSPEHASQGGREAQLGGDCSRGEAGRMLRRDPDDLPPERHLSGVRYSCRTQRVHLSSWSARSPHSPALLHLHLADAAKRPRGEGAAHPRQTSAEARDIRVLLPA
jgi:hypothetical protein